MTLEKLLNTLLEEGRKPFGKEKKEPKFVDIGKEMLLEWEEDYYCSKGYSYRELTSLESGLWQFVCENGMVDEEKKHHERVLDVTVWKEGADCKAQARAGKPEYRLIESALCDEDKLESFILDNIKIDE